MSHFSQQHIDFFFKSKSSIVELELLELTHPNFSIDYRIVRNAVDGIGIQYTKPEYISDMNLLLNDKPTMHTEGTCYNGQNSVEQAFKRLEV